MRVYSALERLYDARALKDARRGVCLASKRELRFTGADFIIRMRAAARRLVNGSLRLISVRGLKSLHCACATAWYFLADDMLHNARIALLFYDVESGDMGNCRV